MSETPKSKSVLYAAIAVSAGAAVFIGLNLFNPVSESQTKKANEESVIKSDKFIPDEAPELDTGELSNIKGFNNSKEVIDSILAQLDQMGSDKDIATLAAILGYGDGNAAELARLKQLYDEKKLELRTQDTAALIGVLKAGKKVRWGVYLKDGSIVQVEVVRTPAGKWKVSDVKLPPSELNEAGKVLTKVEVEEIRIHNEQIDPMNYSHRFLTKLIAQDYEAAREMVNTKKVSDAKIAGLCILFEDGNYALDKENPLQAVRMKETTSAFYVNVKSMGKTSSTLGENAQFSMTTVRSDKKNYWKIEELNLDRLLGDYADRVAGGDVYYTPLFKNPNGGETLVVYFDFDSGELTDRTKRQLGIIAGLLKLNGEKKVRLSGHTDSVGTDDYNQELSRDRAVKVRDYLASQGVADTQLVTEAHGNAQLRRVEKNADGSDDSKARKANRRTEIYLDFDE